jgi:hypothetical protein
VSAPFVSELRARRAPIRLVPPDAPAITIRVEMPEVWDVVKVICEPTQAVLAVKVAALQALYPEAEMHEDFVLKLRGWEILDESAPLGEAGVVDGSILLLTYRRRRPVR